jgi:predicted RNA-binding Zn-ribbon protein involved in translation (DUF1610 family)
MESRIFHGQITPQEIASSILAEFNRFDYRAQQLGSDDRIAVQITTQVRPISGGDTALTVNVQKVEDGISIQLGKQAWLGVAASLGITALSALRNPWTILSRLDDVAQDIENLQLSERVWEVIERTARSANATLELSERLRRLVCEYCDTANLVGEPSCLACGAPLGKSQPYTCPKCGFVVRREETRCPNCGQMVM